MSNNYWTSRAAAEEAELFALLVALIGFCYAKIQTGSPLSATATADIASEVLDEWKKRCALL
jgi:hypothetical protein